MFQHVEAALDAKPQGADKGYEKHVYYRSSRMTALLAN